MESAAHVDPCLTADDDVHRVAPIALFDDGLIGFERDRDPHPQYAVEVGGIETCEERDVLEGGDLDPGLVHAFPFRSCSLPTGGVAMIHS